MDLTSGSDTTLVTLEMTQPCFHLPHVCTTICLPSIVDGRFSHRFVTSPILYEPPIDSSFKNWMHARNTSDNWHPPFGIKIHLTIPPVEALHFLYAHLRVGWMFMAWSHLGTSLMISRFWNEIDVPMCQTWTEKRGHHLPGTCVFANRKQTSLMFWAFIAASSVVWIWITCPSRWSSGYSKAGMEII